MTLGKQRAQSEEAYSRLERALDKQDKRRDYREQLAPLDVRAELRRALLLLGGYRTALGRMQAYMEATSRDGALVALPPVPARDINEERMRAIRRVATLEFQPKIEMGVSQADIDRYGWDCFEAGWRAREEQ